MTDDAQKTQALRDELKLPDKELGPALSAIADGIKPKSDLPDEPAWQGHQGEARVIKSYIPAALESDDDLYEWDEQDQCYWRTRRPAE